MNNPLTDLLKQELHRGELRAQILLLKLELELSEANHRRVEEKIAELQAELNGAGD